MRVHSMKNSIATVFFAFIALVCCAVSMMYPAWSQQHYINTLVNPPVNVFQGFGLFAFYSTGALTSPFYASNTTLFYSDFCSNFAATGSGPNWMLGHAGAFSETLCGASLSAIKYASIFSVVFAAVALVAAVAATFNPSAGIAERIVSSSTLIASLLLLMTLVLWAIQLNQRLLNIDVIGTSYSQCQASSSSGELNVLQGESKWSCWFYGYSFWVAIAAVIGMLITMYTSSAGRAEKIRHFRVNFEADLALALQQSMETAAHGNQHPMVTPAAHHQNMTQPSMVQPRPSNPSTYHATAQDFRINHPMDIRTNRPNPPLPTQYSTSNMPSQGPSSYAHGGYPAATAAGRYV